MAVLRLKSGSDIVVKLTVGETITRLTNAQGDRFVELPGEEGSVHIRPSGVLAVLDEERRGTAGFRVANSS